MRSMQLMMSDAYIGTMYSKYTCNPPSHHVLRHENMQTSHGCSFCVLVFGDCASFLMWCRYITSILSVSMDTMVLRQSSEVSMDTVRNGALISIVSCYTCTLSVMPRSLEFSGTAHPIIRNKKNMAVLTSHGSRVLAEPFEIVLDIVDDGTAAASNDSAYEFGCSYWSVNRSEWVTDGVVVARTATNLTCQL